MSSNLNIPYKHELCKTYWKVEAGSVLTCSANPEIDCDGVDLNESTEAKETVMSDNIDNIDIANFKNGVCISCKEIHVLGLTGKCLNCLQSQSQEIAKIRGHEAYILGGDYYRGYSEGYSHGHSDIGNYYMKSLMPIAHRMVNPPPMVVKCGRAECAHELVDKLNRNSEVENDNE